MTTRKQHKKQFVGAIIALTLSAAALQAQIPTNGLVLRLTGATGVETTGNVPAVNNDPVVEWLDQSGVGNNVSTANSMVASPTEPTYLTGALNGQSIVRFDSATDRLQASTPLLTGTTDFSIFSVIRGSGAGERAIGSNWGYSPTLSGLEFSVYTRKLTLWGYPGISLSGATTLADDTWYIVQLERSGSTYTMRLNNVDDATITAAGSIGGDYNWTIGNNGGYNVGPFGDMAEQIVYTRALSTEERSLVVNQLAGTFGLMGIPEPGTTALLGVGGVVLLWRRQS